MNKEEKVKTMMRKAIDNGVRGNEFVLYCVILSDLIDDDRSNAITYDNLMVRTGIKSRNTLSKYLKSLQKKGYITWTKNKDNTNVYKLR